MQRAPRPRQDRRSWKQRLGKQLRDRAAHGNVLLTLDKRLKSATEQVAKLLRLTKAAHKELKRCAADYQQRPSSTQSLSISSPGLSPIGSPSTPKERKEEKMVQQSALTTRPTTTASRSIASPQPTHPVSTLAVLPSTSGKKEEEKTKALGLTGLTSSQLSQLKYKVHQVWDSLATEFSNLCGPNMALSLYSSH